MQRFKKYTKDKPQRADGADNDEPGTGVKSDVAAATISDETIVELHGKGDIEKIGRHHIDMQKKAKMRSAAKDYHQNTVARARTAWRRANGKMDSHEMRHATDNAASRSKTAKVLKKQIKPTDYKEDLDQADDIGVGATQTNNIKDAPRSARKLQSQADARVKQKQKLAQDERDGKQA